MCHILNLLRTTNDPTHFLTLSTLHNHRTKQNAYFDVSKCLAFAACRFSDISDIIAFLRSGMVKLTAGIILVNIIYMANLRICGQGDTDSFPVFAKEVFGRKRAK